MTDLTKKTIDQLTYGLGVELGGERHEGVKEHYLELLRRYRELRDLARNANRGGMAGTDGVHALAAWLVAQPVEPGEECLTCGGARVVGGRGCDACRGTGRR